MDAHDFANKMADMIDDDSHDTGGLFMAKVRTYADAGVMTRDAGLVVRMPDGSEFQVTIVQSRNGK